MRHLSNTPRQQARHAIVGTVDEAVKAGKLSKRRLDGIELADSGRYGSHCFVSFSLVTHGCMARIRPSRHEPDLGHRRALGALCGLIYAAVRQTRTRVWAAMVAAVLVSRPQKV
jgi:hypothetical protein